MPGPNQRGLWVFREAAGAQPLIAALHDERSVNCGPVIPVWRRVAVQGQRCCGQKQMFGSWQGLLDKMASFIYQDIHFHLQPLLLSPQSSA